jgi:Response regulator of the LytR/AlgR family
MDWRSSLKWEPNVCRYVFVTAYDEHAIRAFEANALDYLLKPFSDERFEATMARVSIRMDERSVREFGRSILRLISAGPAATCRWTVWW